jgi:hypothetical protein
MEYSIRANSAVSNVDSYAGTLDGFMTAGGCVAANNVLGEESEGFAEGAVAALIAALGITLVKCVGPRDRSLETSSRAYLDVKG